MEPKSNDEFIQQLGAILAHSPKKVDFEWDSLAFVATPGEVSGGRIHGYAYEGSSTFKPTVPSAKPSETMRVVIALRDAMAEETGDVWKQALVHITKPGPQIKMQFEYDNPDRWKPEIKGLDMTDYAMSIRPEMP